MLGELAAGLIVSFIMLTVLLSILPVSYAVMRFRAWRSRK
jgi:hypothetical protein